MINQFITHLSTELIVANGFTRVDHAWDIEPFEDIEETDLPAALAFIGSDSSDASNADNLVKQRTESEVWVYTICDTSELDDLRGRLFDAALGWQPSQEYGALQHSRGQVRKISGTKIWWLDVFTIWRINSEQ